MEDKNKKPQEFSLEDILLEFGDHPAHTPTAEPDPAPVQDPEPAPIIPVENAQPEGMGDTRVLPRISGDTIAMDPVKVVRPQPKTMEQTQRIGPVEAPQPELPKKPEIGSRSMSSPWGIMCLRSPSFFTPSPGCGS